MRYSVTAKLLDEENALVDSFTVEAESEGDAMCVFQMRYPWTKVISAKPATLDEEVAYVASRLWDEQARLHKILEAAENEDSDGSRAQQIEHYKKLGMHLQRVTNAFWKTLEVHDKEQSELACKEASGC